MHKTGFALPLEVLVAFTLICAPCHAQQPRQYTAQDYAAAEKFMFYNLNPLAWKGVVNAAWLPGERFVYRAVDESGYRYTLVDPAKRTTAPMFDQDKVAAALKEASKGAIDTDGAHLMVSDLALSGDDRVLTLTAADIIYRCDLAAQPASCKAVSAASGWPVDSGRGSPQPPMTLSPNKKLGAFIRDWNLWVRDLATGAETQLTTVGVKDYGYATDNPGWRSSDAAILLWSPDSTRIATFQQDQRKTGEMYLVPITNGHPQLKAWKYPLAGDKDITMIERVIIDVPARKVIRLHMPPDQHRSTLCDDIACNGVFSDVEWSPSASDLAFISTARDHKQVWFRVADASTGDVREVMTETAPTFFQGGQDRVNWHYLPASNEILWFSERDDWGNLYLYDLVTGKLKNQITSGPGNVTQVLRVDEKARVIYFLGVGREPGRNPYFQGFYSVHFDGSGLHLLTPEDADHDVRLSPGGRYFVDTYSTRTQPKVTVVRDSDGKPVMDVARQDISKLLAAGWMPPTPFTVKARDASTDIYGYMFKPTHLDPTQKYPIVDFIYPGPQGKSCPDPQFEPSFVDLQSLAELGFVVVCIDAMGTEWRSKSFHAAYYGNMGDNGLPDQVAGIRQLASRYSFIDLDRVGIYGHSGGGFAAADAMLRYPDFFKVGISESGNHDNRDYEDDWGEKWQGLEVIKPDGSSNYDPQANQNLAKNLKGHLLLTHGTMDDNVPPNNTLVLIDALIRANKDFDLVLFPNAHHGYGPNGVYMTRRRWDYFVRYLREDIPPPAYQMKSYDEVHRIQTSGP
jgi:dipeptidyl-peptidase 4